MSSFNKHLLQSMCLTLYKLAQVPQVRQFQWAAILLITIGETSVVSCNKCFFFVKGSLGGGVLPRPSNIDLL